MPFAVGKNKNATLTPTQIANKQPPPPKAVHMEGFWKFIFPSHLEHPEATGRLDVFAHFGPCDDDGNLRGGWCGQHVNTDLEIRHMIWKLNRNTFEELFPQPKETTETMVNELLPKANSHCYTKKEIVRLLNTLAPDADGRCQFGDMQRLILADQRRRFLTLMAGGEISEPTREPIPFQTYPQQELKYITRLPKLRKCEEFLVTAKNLHSKGWAIAPMELQGASASISANMPFVAENGRLDDKWDRYCGIRQQGKVSYVKARNIPRATLHGMDPLGSKYPQVQDIMSSRMLNCARTAPKCSC